MTEQNPLYVKIVDHYKIDEKYLLGQGAFGSVYSAIDNRTDKQVAVKTISRDKFSNSSDKIKQNIKNEIRNMQLLNHPNIVQLFDVQITENYIYLIMEFCNGGNLQDLLNNNRGRFSMYQTLKIIKQIVQGFKCLYENKIVHRDLKPANIIINNDEVKISDFGFSKVVDAGGMEEQVLKSLVGSPAYMSPQILQNQQYSSKTDIWSLGIMFYQLLYQKTPWDGDNFLQLMENIERKKLYFPDTTYVDVNIKNLISLMLQKEEKDRISWEDLFIHSLMQSDEQQIKGSLESIDYSYKVDILQKSKALTKVYFESNKVLTSSYECARRKKINEVILHQFQLQQNGRKAEDNGEQQKKLEQEKLNLEKMNLQDQKNAQKNNVQPQENQNNQNALLKKFNQQKLNQQDKEKINKVVNWALHRRNLASFCIQLAIKLYDMQIELEVLGIDTSLFYKVVFLLLKYHKLIMYKLYRRVKYNDPAKYQKYSKEDYELFKNSEQKIYLQEFIKSDINISSYFFEEFLKLTKKVLDERKDDLASQQDTDKFNLMKENLNNKVSKKDVFKNLWELNMQEFNTQLLQKISNTNTLTKDITNPAFFLKLITEKPQAFKFTSQQRIDFSKLYEDIETMNPENTFQKLKIKMQ